MAFSVEGVRLVVIRKAYMACSLTLFLCLGVGYNTIFLGRLLPVADKGHFVLPLGIVFNFFLVMALWSYFSTHFSDPGAIPHRWRDFVLGCGNALTIAAPREEWQPRKATFCRRCNIARPERAHHCSICGVCVLRYDHHCPWTDNCVGFHNHKMFLLAMGYGCIASWLALCTSFPQLVACFMATLRSVEASKGAWPRLAGALVAFHSEALHPNELIAFYILFILCLLLGVLLTWLLSIHVPLALKNCTTVEGNYDQPNPFDVGNDLQNLVQVFGKPGIDWFLPIRPFRPVCDGIAFTRELGEFSSSVADMSGCETCLLDGSCAGDAAGGAAVEDGSGKPIAGSSTCASASDVGGANYDGGQEDFALQVRWRNRYNVPLLGHGTSPLGRLASPTASSSPHSGAAAVAADYTFGPGAALVGPAASSASARAAQTARREYDGKDASPLYALARWLDNATAFAPSTVRYQSHVVDRTGAPEVRNPLAPPRQVPQGDDVRPCRSLVGTLQTVGLGRCANSRAVSDEVREADAESEALPIRGRSDGKGGGGGGSYVGARELHRGLGEEVAWLPPPTLSRGSAESPRRPQRGMAASVTEWFTKALQEATGPVATPEYSRPVRGERMVVAL